MIIIVALIIKNYYYVLYYYTVIIWVLHIITILWLQWPIIMNSLLLIITISLHHHKIICMSFYVIFTYWKMCNNGTIITYYAIRLSITTWLFHIITSLLQRGSLLPIITHFLLTNLQMLSRPSLLKLGRPKLWRSKKEGRIQSIQMEYIWHSFLQVQGLWYV